MKYSCPHCKSTINKKDVLLKGIITCNSCKKDCALGNFLQMLTAALIGLVSVFIVTFGFQHVDFVGKSVLSIGVVILVIAIAIYVIARPVPYTSKRNSQT